MSGRGGGGGKVGSVFSCRRRRQSFLSHCLRTGQEDDFRAANTARLRTAARTMDSEDHKTTVCILNYCGAPLDRFIQFLAHADMQQQCSRESGSPETQVTPIVLRLTAVGDDNPAVQTQGELTELLKPGSGLATFLDIHAQCHGDAWWHRWGLRSHIMVQSYCAELRLRVEWPGQCFPLAMWQLANGSQDRHLVSLQRFLDMPPCCLDASGSRKAQAYCKHLGVAGTLSSGFLTSLAKMARDISIAIITEERQHKANLDIATQSSKPVGAQRLYYDSTLKQFQRQFFARGGTDSSYLQREVLRASNTNIQRNIKGRRRLRKRTRLQCAGNPMMFFVSLRMSQKGKKQSGAEAKAFQAAARQEWAQLPESKRQEFKQVWQARKDQARAKTAATGIARQPVGGMAQSPPMQHAWSIGDSVWPVATAKVERLAARARARVDQRCPGFVAAGRVLQKEHLLSMAVGDPRLGPPPQRAQATTCWEVHPGFCITRHAAIAPRVQAIAQNMVALWAGQARKDLLGRFFLLALATQAGDMLQQWAIGLFAVRFARPALQTFGLYTIAPVDPVDAHGSMLLTRATRDSSPSAGSVAFTHELAVDLASHTAWADGDLVVTITRLEVSHREPSFECPHAPFPAERQ